MESPDRTNWTHRSSGGPEDRHCARVAGRTSLREWCQWVAALLVVCGLAGCAPQPEELWSDAREAIAAGNDQAAAIHLKNLLQLEPQRAEARIALGEVALRLGDLTSAEKELQRARELGSGWSAYGVPLAKALLAQGKYEDALKVLGDPQAMAGTQLEMLRGQAYESMRKWDLAEASYRQVIQASPEDPQGYTAMAGLLMANGRAAEADALIEAALALDPDDVPALVMQGRRLVDRKDPQAAERIFEKASRRQTDWQSTAIALANLIEVQLLQGRVQDAGASLQRMQQVAPGSFMTRFLTARWQAQSGNYAEAIRGLQGLLNEQPAFRPAERLLGTLHYLSGNLEQAALYISKVAADEPGDAFTRRLLAEIRLQQAQPSQAMAILGPALQRAPVTLDQGMLVVAGQASLMLGDSDAALTYFRRGAEAFPDDERFRFGEVTARLASGDLKTARQLLADLRSSARNQVGVDYLSIVVLVLEREHDQAVKLATRLVQEHEKAAWAHMLLAAVHMVAGNTDRARAGFQTALQLDSRNKDALINLARLDMSAGDAAGAEAHLKRAQASDPGDYRPRLLLADIYLGGGRAREALGEAREAARLAPDLPAAFNLTGQAALALGDAEESRRGFVKVTQLSPDDPVAWLNLGRASAMANAMADARAAAQQAVALAPQDAQLLTAAGDVLLKAREPALAASQYERAFAVSPAGPRAMGACQARFEAQLEKPCELLDRWIRQHAEDTRARMFRAVIAERAGNLRSAIADYEAVLAVRPDDAAALNNLAWLYHQTGDDRAQATAEQALRAAPDVAAVIDTAGWIALHSGDRNRGMRLIGEAAAKAPENPDIRYHLAYAQAQSGQVEQARSTLDELLARVESFDSRSEAEQLRTRLAEAGQ